MRLLSKWKVLLQCSRAGMVRYTTKARRTIFFACDQAIQEMSNEVTPEYLLVGLLRADDSLRARLGLPGLPTIDSVRNQLSTHRHQRQPATSLVLSQAAKHAIVLATEEREHLSHKHTGTEHLLLGIIRSGSVAAKVLEQRELTVDRVRQLLSRQNLGVESRNAESVFAFSR